MRQGLPAGVQTA